MAFTALPAELLHHVASFCAPHDVLALTATCRLLQNTYDESLFRQAFEQHIPEVSSSSIANNKALVASISEQLKINTQETLQDPTDCHRAWWKYLAVAAFHSSLLRDELRGSYSIATSDMSADSLPWLSEISKRIKILKGPMRLLATSVVWGCQSICDEDVMRVLDDLCAYTYSGKLEHALFEDAMNGAIGLEVSFCSAICAIQNSRGSQPDREGNVPENSDNEQDQVRVGFTIAALRRYVDTNMYHHIPESALPCMALLLCAAAARACLRQNPKVENAPPLLENIPFFSYAMSQGSSDPGSTVVTSSPAESIPLPRVATALEDERGPPYPQPTVCHWDWWYRTRTRALIGEIDSCEWEGLYTYGFKAQSRIDPVMRRIRFQKSSESENRINIVALECQDGVGTFKLEGSVDLETCGIRIQKRYTGRHGFQWRGSVTPLGISGCYLSNWDENLPLGAFWLWRRDWKSSV
ncbi:unnamed protein product [Clonostachys rosea]|uniref:F-box domain-containing protein n=1 Tax=Bionectria ochroleuca TaxID=29856 RepID=A0ABY6UZW1_BIOOC|nr:unnamed protein product [Clonostachys rosea]